MYPISAAARQVLRGSHGITARAMAYTATGVLPDLPLTGASVTVDGTSQVRRTGSATIADPSLWPSSALSPLSPVGSELRIDFGIIIPGQDEPEWVPMIRGPIQSVADKLPSTDPITVKLSDRSAGVNQARLLSPGQTIAGRTYVQEITRLITEVQPAATVLDYTGDTTVCPVTEIEAERWKDGVEPLATAIGAEVYAAADGETYIIRPQPTLSDPPVWVVDAGRGGVMISCDREVNRDGIYNAVTARGSTTDGTTPVSATVVDDDVASPTYYGGPFGQRVRYYVSPLLKTVEQCQAAAAALLARTKGYVATVKVEQLTNPALESGDVILVVMPDGTTQTHIIDSLPIDTSPGATQQLTTRSIDVLPSEQDQSTPGDPEGAG